MTDSKTTGSATLNTLEQDYEFGVMEGSSAQA